MSNFKVTKMDGRHTGREFFTHYINFFVYTRGVFGGGIQNNEVNFLRARVWFWEKFGPSGELGKVGKMKNVVEEMPLWAWQTEHNNLRIYVTEKSLDFFMLVNSA